MEFSQCLVQYPAQLEPAGAGILCSPEGSLAVPGKGKAGKERVANQRIAKSRPKPLGAPPEAAFKYQLQWVSLHREQAWASLFPKGLLRV